MNRRFYETKETRKHINVWPVYLLRLKCSNVIFLNRLYSISIFNICNKFTSTNWTPWGAGERCPFSPFSCFLPSAVTVSSSHRWEASHRWQESQESHCFLLFDWRWTFKTLISVPIHSSHFHFPKPTGQQRIKPFEFTYACGLLKTRHYGDTVSPWCGPAGPLFVAIISCFPLNSVSRNIINDNSSSNWIGNETMNQCTVKKDNFCLDLGP